MNESILKADQVGRLRYTPEQKKTMVEAYWASGLESFLQTASTKLIDVR